MSDTNNKRTRNDYSDAYISEALGVYVDEYFNPAEPEDRKDTEDTLIEKLKSIDNKTRFDLKKEQPLLGAILLTILNSRDDHEEKVQRFYNTLSRLYDEVDFSCKRTFDITNDVSEQVELLQEEVEGLKKTVDTTQTCLCHNMAVMKSEFKKIKDMVKELSLVITEMDGKNKKKRQSSGSENVNPSDRSMNQMTMTQYATGKNM